ncbi:MAG: AbrB/MazE/SpoVT family DNA-binding domain-containing protein, partial [Spirochaetes bacterium]|nr:AbrB/MazE/SpoVT family DNA-binding domain-containing protein [Spirochaetota bacterium]MCK5570035.1 AbrB/MazE/SpoVT family DNA-binding domain-containing protein [Spirochaetota bacterium]
GILILDLQSKNYYIISMKTIVSEKGQITIPKKIRDKLGITPGTVLEVDTDRGRLIAVKKQVVDVFQKWRGKGKIPGNMNVDDYLKKVRG